MVGRLFGIVGLFVAVPIISAMVILTEEYWVKEVEAPQAHGRGADAAISSCPAGGRADRNEMQSSRLALRLSREIAELGAARCGSVSVCAPLGVAPLRSSFVASVSPAT